MEKNLSLSLQDFKGNNRLEKSFTNELEKSLDGGKADFLSIDDIAKKHKVEPSQIEKELEMGMKVELEHTTDKETAREIALDHLVELPDYYTRLKKVERGTELKKSLEDTFDNLLEKGGKPIGSTSVHSDGSTWKKVGIDDWKMMGGGKSQSSGRKDNIKVGTKVFLEDGREGKVVEVANKVHSDGTQQLVIETSTGKTIRGIGQVSTTPTKVSTASGKEYSTTPLTQSHKNFPINTPVRGVDKKGESVSGKVVGYGTGAILIETSTGQKVPVSTTNIVKLSR